MKNLNILKPPQNRKQILLVSLKRIIERSRSHLRREWNFTFHIVEVDYLKKLYKIIDEKFEIYVEGEE
jgi:hypothetical protein